MKTELTRLLVHALQQVAPTLADPASGALAIDPNWVTLERTRDPVHGDFACNIAMRLAKAAKRKPRDIAEAIIQALPASPLVAKAEVAGAGFINLFLARDVYVQELMRVHEHAERYGRVNLGAGRKVNLEFVSANPTGPMHVGHGRQAAYGAALGNLLEAAGFNVYREFYVNDAGRQMEILAVSVWLRYIEQGGETIVFPQNAYRGDYILPVAASLRVKVGGALQQPAAKVFADLPPDSTAGGDKDKYVDAVITRARELIGDAGFQQVLQHGLDEMLAEIQGDLAAFGVRFDRWTSEREFTTSGAIDRAIGKLREQNRIYEKDGAQWFRATEFGDDEDRVVVRENGIKTYFASDIAYHLDKRERGFEILIDVLGADHHGYVARVRGGLTAMGEPGDSLEVCLIQLVSLYRDGVKLQMGKREATFVTLRQLREEVGNDACRLFYLMRSNDQPLDFDLDLAKSKSNENPVFYMQYAHARVASVMKELVARNLPYDARSGRDAALADGGAHLAGEAAQALMVAISRYGEIIELAAAQRAPHALAHYLRDLANDVHTFYAAERVLVPEAAPRAARVYLLQAAQQVIRNGLAILGASAPESM